MSIESPPEADLKDLEREGSLRRSLDSSTPKEPNQAKNASRKISKGTSFSVPKDSNLIADRREDKSQDDEIEGESSLLESLNKLEEMNEKFTTASWERAEEEEGGDEGDSNLKANTGDSFHSPSDSSIEEISLDFSRYFVLKFSRNGQQKRGILKVSEEEVRKGGDKSVSFDMPLSPRSLDDGSSSSSYAFCESSEDFSSDDEYFASNGDFNSTSQIKSNPAPIIPSSPFPFFDPEVECSDLDERLWMKIVNFCGARELFQLARSCTLLNGLALPRLKKLQYKRLHHSDRTVMMHLSSRPELASLVKHITIDLNGEDRMEKKREELMIPTFALEEANKKFQKLGKLLALEKTNFSSMIPTTLQLCNNLRSLSILNPTNDFLKKISFVKVRELSISWGQTTQKQKFDLGSLSQLLTSDLRRFSFQFAPFMSLKDQDKIITIIGGCQQLEAIKLVDLNVKKKKKRADHLLFTLHWPNLKSLSITTSNGDFEKECANPLFWKNHSDIEELQMYDSGLSYLQHNTLLKLERLVTTEDGLLELSKHNENSGDQRPLKHIYSTFTYSKEKPYRRLSTLNNLKSVVTFLAPLEIADKFSIVAASLPPSCTFYCECRGVNLAKTEVALTWLKPIEESLASIKDHATIIFYSQSSPITATLRPTSKGGLVIDTIKKDFVHWFNEK
eukprot:TRINITY_DN6315_c0_g1_i1.p1 TRINITY_DN6315_c0_g1~~TRINITY_DN6315_c0_g1_i1.p1  ORF type:complete len:676 (-),score=253.76 TRINITY_DN6315_c0_g1_i1:326-2353(-)